MRQRPPGFVDRRGRSACDTRFVNEKAFDLPCLPSPLSASPPRQRGSQGPCAAAACIAARSWRRSARRDFGQLLSLIADERSIDPVLVEKHYRMMHCLWGLQAQGLRFELEGGTSLSKGFGIIHRFSENIDIGIEPPATLDVKTGRNHDKAAYVESRRSFHDWLAREIRIPGRSQIGICV
jgi:hypothetical protein